MKQVKNKLKNIADRMKGGKSLKSLLEGWIPNSPNAVNDSMSQQADGAVERRYFRQSLLIVGAALVIMLLFFLGAFFLAVKGSEKTVVPNVMELDIFDALTRLQERELYPRVNVKFTGNPADKGLIIGQSPESGLYVKAGRRITLTVSRGAVIDRVEDYVGKSVDELRKRLVSLFSTFEPLIVVREPIIFVYNEAAPGTILAQTPEAGTPLSDPIELVLIASRGKTDKPVQIPDWSGWNTVDVLESLSERPFPFQFVPSAEQPAGSINLVTSQNPPGGTALQPGSPVVLNYRPPAVVPKGSKYGLLKIALPDYPVPVLLEALVRKADYNQDETLLSMAYLGGDIAFPYIIPEDAEIIIAANGTEIHRE